MAGVMDGKAGLVTGAAGGIGRATAVAFAREGAAVVVADLEQRRSDGEETVRLVEADGGRAAFVACDVTRAAEQEALVRAAVERFGALDFAHNNAGVELQALLTETAEPDWDLVIDVNVKGVAGTQGTDPADDRPGRRGDRQHLVARLIGAPALGAYVASKHAVVGLTKTAAIECAPHNIRVNAVCPAAIATAMIKALSPERQQELASPQAIKRFGQPEEVAEAVVWLCSDRASFVPGTAMAVDAGSTAGIVLPGVVT